jgi:hypothetical protein
MNHPTVIVATKLQRNIRRTSNSVPQRVMLDIDDHAERVTHAPNSDRFLGHDTLDELIWIPLRSWLTIKGANEIADLKFAFVFQ